MSIGNKQKMRFFSWSDKKTDSERSDVCEKPPTVHQNNHNPTNYLAKWFFSIESKETKM